MKGIHMVNPNHYHPTSRYQVPYPTQTCVVESVNGWVRAALLLSATTCQVGSAHHVHVHNAIDDEVDHEAGGLVVNYITQDFADTHALC
jgi:hypothetical protein